MTHLSFPKDPRQENPHLLAMAQNKPCLFRWVADCRGESDTTVACHENTLAAGKGRSYKPHDFLTAWGCVACHVAYDQGDAPQEEKAPAFDRAHERQLREWRCIASNRLARARDRAAAQWALDAHQQHTQKRSAHV